MHVRLQPKTLGNTLGTYVSKLFFETSAYPCVFSLFCRFSGGAFTVRTVVPLELTT
jgi:hypothetical protein